MSSVVLDASALFAFLFNEPGAAAVASRMPDGFLSATNYAEVLTRAVDRGRPLDDAIAQVARLQLTVVPFDAVQAATAASLRTKTRTHGLSLGDRACLALALTHNLPALTGDKAWTELDIGVKVELIR